MITTYQQLVDLLAAKQVIDALHDGKYTQTNRWLIESVELLLRIEIDRREIQNTVERMDTAKR